MNLVLFRPHEIVGPGRAVVGGARARHLVEVLGVTAGRELRVAEIGSTLGRGRVAKVTEGLVEFEYRLGDEAPPPARLDLILAMPRPKVLRRVLENLASYGIRRAVLVRSARVDKSYLEAPILEEERRREHLLVGCEQAVDPRPCELGFEPLFRPFVEDRAAAFAGEALPLVFHPGGEDPGPAARSAPAGVCLAIGPEGGWTPFEVDLFRAAGFRVAGLGPRIHRVEAAIAWAAARCTPETPPA
ncbi:MAG: RsmE family RNA methyltransferase [Planctomycetota bacterium]